MTFGEYNRIGSRDEGFEIVSSYRKYNVRYRDDKGNMNLTCIDSKSPKEAVYEIGRQLGYTCRQRLQGMIYNYIYEITAEQANNYKNKGLVIEVWLKSKPDRPHKFFVVTQ